MVPGVEANCDLAQLRHHHRPASLDPGKWGQCVEAGCPSPSTESRRRLISSTAGGRRPIRHRPLFSTEQDLTGASSETNGSVVLSQQPVLLTSVSLPSAAAP